MQASVQWDASWGYEESGGPQRHWWAAAVLALALYGVVALLLLRMPLKPSSRQEGEKPQEVTFRELVEVKPPPAEQPVPEPAPAVAAPVIPKHLKVRKVESIQPKPLVAPKAMPKEAPREADPAEDKGVAVAGDPAAGGDPAGLEGGLAGARGPEAVALPEDADPPVPLPTNQPPAYPQQARAEGRTGVVVLKVVITTDGAVADVQVLRGEEPFASVAAAAVRQWRYKPAMYQGKPITVYRIIQIPFKLQA